MGAAQARGARDRCARLSMDERKYRRQPYRHNKRHQTAFVDHPSSGHGTTWDQITKSDEESIHLAKAVLIALRKAGYSISKVEEGMPRGPKGEKRRRC